MLKTDVILYVRIANFLALVEIRPFCLFLTKKILFSRKKHLLWCLLEPSH